MEGPADVIALVLQGFERFQGWIARIQQGQSTEFVHPEKTLEGKFCFSYDGRNFSVRVTDLSDNPIEIPEEWERKLQEATMIVYNNLTRR